MVSFLFRFPIVMLLCTTTLSYQVSTAQAQMALTPSEINISGGLAWNGDDSLIAVGTTDGLWLHDSETLSVVGQVAIGETIHALDTTTFDHRIAIGTADGRVEVWDLDLQQQLLEIVVSADEHPRGPVYFIDLSPDGLYLTTDMFGNPGRVWNAITGELILEIPNIAFGMTWNPSSDQFVAEVEDGGIDGIWTIEGDFVRSLSDGDILHFALVWSPNGEWIAGGYREQLDVLNANTGELAFSTEAITRPHRGNIEAIAWNPTSRLFALHAYQAEGLTSLPNVIQIWSVEDFTITHELEGIRFVELGLRSMAWNHSGDRFAAVSGDGYLYVWDAETFELLNEYDGYASLNIDTDS